MVEMEMNGSPDAFFGVFFSLLPQSTDAAELFFPSTTPKCAFLEHALRSLSLYWMENITFAMVNLLFLSLLLLKNVIIDLASEKRRRKVIKWVLYLPLVCA